MFVHFDTGVLALTRLFLKSFPTIVDYPTTTNAMSQTPTATASNANYQFIFDNALEAYRKKTKKDLRSHPLLAELHACNSPDAVLTILRKQIDQSRSASSADGRLMSWLNPTVNVLYTLSEAVGGGISLVSINMFGFNLPKI